MAQYIREITLIRENVTNTIKHLTKETAIYGVGNVITRLITFLLLPILTNLLSPKEYGQITLIYVFLGFMNIIYHYGLDIAFMRNYSKLPSNNEKKQLFSTSFWLGVLTSAFLSILLIFSSQHIASFILGNHIYSHLFKLCAMILFLDSISHVPFGLLRLQGNASYFVIIKLLNVLITLICNIYFVALEGLGLYGVFISVAIASACTTLCVFSTSLKFIGFKFQRKLVKSLLKFGLPFLPAGLASIAMESLDRYLLAILTNADTVGVYSVGYKLGIFMLLLTNAFHYAWQPFFLRAGNQLESKVLFSKIFNYFLVVSTFVWIGITLFLPEIINIRIGGYWLIGPAFHAAKIIVPIILLAYLFQGVYFNFLPGIYFKNKTHYIPIIIGFGALINLVVNLILIPRYGMLGAAYATLIGHSTIAIITFFVSRKMFLIPYNWAKVLRLIISLSFALLPAYLFNFITIGRILSLIFFGIGIIIFQVVSIQEIKKVFIKK